MLRSIESPACVDETEDPVAATDVGVDRRSANLGQRCGTQRHPISVLRSQPVRLKERPQERRGQVGGFSLWRAEWDRGLGGRRRC